MPDHARIMGQRPTRIPGLQLFQELARHIHTPLLPVELQILGGGEVEGGGGRSERQMTNEQKRMNNDLGCWGRTGGSHRRAGRARYKTRQGGFFFFFLFPSQKCAAARPGGRQEEHGTLAFSQSCVFTCKQELNMLRLVPTSQRVGPPSTQSHLPSQPCTLHAKQNGRKQNIKLAQTGGVEPGFSVFQSELVPRGRSVQRVFKTIRRSGPTLIGVWGGDDGIIC